MENIAVDWEAFPPMEFLLNLYALFTTLEFWERCYSILIGLLMAGHFHAMVNADKGNSPLALKVIVLACVGCGLVIFANAAFVLANWSIAPALYVTPLVAFVMFIWTHGFHVCDFVDRIWGAKGGGR